MSQIRPSFVRVLSALGLALLVGGLGGSCGSSPPPRLAGIPEFQQLALRPVPGAGAVVNVVARNLLISRTDLSIDTRLGTHSLGATYNAATGAWLWSFDITYDGETFVDDTGAVFDTTQVAPGQAIAGTHWVVVDDDTLETKGGLVHQFDPAGLLASVRWASAPWPRIVFVSGPVAGGPRITRIDQCTAPGACSEVFDLAYGGAGRLIGVTDRAGRQAAFTYDAQGRLATARDGLDTEKGWPGFRYEYIDGKIAAITNSEGERVEYRFTSKRLEVEAIGAEHPLRVFRYDGKTDGLHATEITDPEGHVVRYRWDGQRRLHALESVDTGETTTFAWSGRRPIERVLPDGVTTAWTYTGDDVATELQPSGNVVSFTYAPGAVDRASPTRRPIARIEDSLGLVEERGYDTAGRLVSLTNGAGETTTFTYDSDQMLASRTDPAGVTTGFAGYGEHGHPTEITRSGSEGSATRVYDAVGNLLELRGELDIGGVARREYDADRNVAEVHLRSYSQGVGQGPVEILTVEHRSDGRRNRILRPHGDDAEFGYDILGRLVERREKADGVWRTTIFERDPLGRVTATQRPNGMRQEMTYDALGREATRTIGWGDPIAPESSATFTYEDGRRVEILDSVHGEPEKIIYDFAGRPKGISYPGGELLFLAYDLRSRVTYAALWIPEFDFTRTIELAYDGVGREVAVVDGDQEVLARVYEAGRLAETRYGNGLKRAYGYYSDGTLNALETIGNNGEVVESSGVGFGTEFLGIFLALAQTTTPDGFFTEEESELFELKPQPGNSPPLAGARVSFWGSLVDVPGFGYDYDSLSNVTRRDEVPSFTSLDHVYNPEHNRLLRIETEAGIQHNYTYDAAGYVVERNETPLAWDGAGRIAAIGAVASFVWDTLGRPVSSTVMGVSRTHRFGGLVTADELGNPMSMSLGEVKIDLVTDGHRYRHLDFRGNVAFVTDETGTIVAQYHYNPYGVRKVFGDSAQGPSFARGRALGDLVLLGHRLLDRDAARFLAPDPIYQLINQYAYAMGNPVQFWDPSGLAPQSTEGTSGAEVLSDYARGVFGGLVGFLITRSPLGIFLGAGVGTAVGPGSRFVGEKVLGPSIPANPRTGLGGNIRVPPAPTPAPFGRISFAPELSPLGTFSAAVFAQPDFSPGLICSGGECVPCIGCPDSNPFGPPPAARAVATIGSGGGGGGGCSPTHLSNSPRQISWLSAWLLLNLMLAILVLVHWNTTHRSGRTSKDRTKR